MWAMGKVRGGGRERRREGRRGGGENESVIYIYGEGGREGLRKEGRRMEADMKSDATQSSLPSLPPPSNFFSGFSPQRHH